MVNAAGSVTTGPAATFSGRVAPRAASVSGMMCDMTTPWPTHRARARWARQTARYHARQRKLARRAARRGHKVQEVRPA